MHKIFPYLGRRLLQLILSMLIGIAVTVVAGVYYYANTLPELNSWHTVKLDNEFTPDKFDQIHSFNDYIQLEEKLFAEVQQNIYQKITVDEQTVFSRYSKTSVVNPYNHKINWNKTRELPVDKPKAACLLIHGLSDSPYSLYELAIMLQQQQCWTITLRLPGHGTVPAALLNVNNESFKRAVGFAAQHLKEKIGSDLPFYIIGYSTGATLAIDYALSHIKETQIEGETLPEVEAMVFISPAIGVSGAASFAVWQRVLSYVPVLENLAWNSVLPEYDPYKYNSFTINAAEQVYDLTIDIQQRLFQLAADDGLANFPPTLTFMSAVDDTVSVDATLGKFLMLLPPNQHELVVYDIDRNKYSPLLFSTDAASITTKVLETTNPFNFVLVTNKNAQTNVIKLIEHGTKGQSEIDTDMVWPEDLYSLSHTALPISYQDVIYGNGDALGDNGVNLGNISLRGERNVLRVPPGQLSRLRYNPFYDFQEAKILNYLQLSNDNTL